MFKSHKRPQVGPELTLIIINWKVQLTSITVMTGRLYLEGKSIALISFKGGMTKGWVPNIRVGGTSRPVVIFLALGRGISTFLDQSSQASNLTQ